MSDNLRYTMSLEYSLPGETVKITKDGLALWIALVELERIKDNPAAILKSVTIRRER